MALITRSPVPGLAMKTIDLKMSRTASRIRMRLVMTMLVSMTKTAFLSQS
jgi:hypothetical protein